MRQIEKYITKFPLLVMVLIVLFAISGCGTRKSAMRTENNSTVSEQTQITDTTSIKKNEVSNVKDETSETVTTTKVTYDTDKPINPETGKPPVKSEETTTKKKDNSKKIEIIVESSVNKGITDAISRTEQSNQETTANQEKKETTIPKQIGWCALGIAILISLFILYKKYR